MSSNRTVASSACPTAAPPTRRRNARRQIDASDLAHLIGERLAALEHDRLPDHSSPCALLLVRLTVNDGPRVLLPTVCARSMLPIIRSRLADVLQEADRYSILGPTEVLVFLNCVKSESVARLAMTRLLRALTPRSGGDSAFAQFNPAIGGAMPSAQTRTAEQLAAMADLACGIAGESEERLHLVVGGAAVPDRSDLVPELRAAIESNRLDVHYQPQFSFARRHCSTVEALVRWPRPPGATPVAPDTLVDVASRHGLIQALTRFVLNTSFREARELSRSGPELGVAVNLSPTQFGDAELPDVVAQALSVWSFPPELLTLEITEVSDMRDAQAALTAMKRLRNLGIRLSIDDFGTGFSSLARLRAMPLAELKIDRLFVAGMNRSRADLQIVRSVIDLAHNFELEVIAEGVEDEATVRHLHALGCDAIQGYFYARPMGIDNLRTWWEKRPDFASLLDDPPAQDHSTLTVTAAPI
jgi:EAL domain-containing protein (putative c-di-GMP-specific phosphodiesterase class I)